MTDSRILHIGANDAVGRALSDNPNITIVSHDGLSKINFERFSKITISGFNPKRKLLINNESDIIDYLIKACTPQTPIVYISSCRVSDFKADMGEESPYVVNKITDERKLLDYFDCVSILYLPILIPSCELDSSRFFEILFSNLKDNTISFDFCSVSSWNFIHANDVANYIINCGCKERFQTLLSENSVVVNELSAWFLRKYNGLQITYGTQKAVYPRFIPSNVSWAQTNLGENLCWLNELERLYNGKTS